jgi:hypothetical protein
MLATLLAVSGISVGAGTASAAVPNWTIRSGTGTTLRAVFYENSNYTGATLRYYGSGPCTSTTTDADFSLSVMPAGWNDVVSSVRDYNSCDVKLYRDNSFGGGTTGFVNYGSGKTVPSGWNEITSSFRVS